jgi:TolB-like protein/Flp pilus assembly protein TadD
MESELTHLPQDSFYVGDWQVRPAQGVLVRDGTIVRLEPKSMEVLCYLSSRPDEVITREDIERDVWRGAVLGYDSITSTIAKLRKALADDTREPRYVATIPKRGYRLIARLRKEIDPASVSIPAQNNHAIAVLPFVNLSNDPGQDYFADGITDDLITALSRFHWFFVIARNSSYAFKGRTVDAKRVAAELGAQYLLEGSVRKTGDRVRINTQLIDGTTACNIWAERYDRDATDIFLVQDEISKAITTTIAPAFIRIEAQRAGRKASEKLDVWDCTARGNWYLWRRGRTDIEEAIRLFTLALNIDPQSTAALSGLAFALCWVYLFGWSDDLEAVRARALAAARQAVGNDDSDAWSHATLGWSYFISHELDAAINEGERALELNPSLAIAASVLSIAGSWRGNNDQALQYARLAQRLSPCDPGYSMWSFALASAEFGAGNYEKAVGWAKLASTIMPEFPGAWRYLASSLGHLDRKVEARVAVKGLLNISPHDNLELIRARLPSVRKERLDQFVDGLRKAGLPEILAI